MAEDKKKVIVYSDWIDLFEALEDDEAGRLIKHFFRYVNDKNPTSDRLTEISFIPIKQTLKRDLQSWNNKRNKNSQNGKLGGRPKKSEENPNKANGFFEKPTKAKKAVSDSVSVSDSKEDNNTPTKVDEINFEVLLAYINETFGRSFKVVNKKAKEAYKATLKQGYTKDQIRQAIQNAKNAPFHIENNYQYCTVEYFSRPKTIDMYSQTSEVKKPFEPIKKIYD